MDFPLLIGIHGVARSGKDTTAGFIQEWGKFKGHGFGNTFRKRGFADKLKLSVARIFYPDISQEDAIEWCDKIKIDEDPSNRTEIWEYHTWAPDRVVLITGRQLLQRYGTESHRDVFGGDFWVDQLLPTGFVGHQDFIEHGNIEGVSDRPYTWDWWKNFQLMAGPAAPIADLCVITDLRFPNELARIRELGGQAWKVENDTALENVLKDAEARGVELHPSELLMDDDKFDVILDNNDWEDPEHLRVQVHEAMNELAVA